MPPTRRRKHSWPRFSLRLLLIAMSLAAIWMGFMASSARKQKTATDAAVKAGGHVYYDFQINDGRLNPAAPARGPAWLRKMIGRDWFDNVQLLSLENPDRINANDHEIATIVASLPRVEVLHLLFPPAGEQTLRNLDKMPRLTTLMISGEKFTDENLRHLHKLNLTTLWLTDTQVSEEGLRMLQEAIPKCNAQINQSSEHDDLFN